MRSVARAESARQRVLAWLPAPGVVLTGPGTVAWSTGGLEALAAGYAASDAINGWKGHYQGGPIGYAQREFEIAPGQAGSRWYRQPIGEAHAVAWNPSLPGGAKAEDTYLVAGRLSRLTDAPGWPAEEADSRRPRRPAVLEVGT